MDGPGEVSPTVRSLLASPRTMQQAYVEMGVAPQPVLEASIFKPPPGVPLASDPQDPPAPLPVRCQPTTRPVPLPAKAGASTHSVLYSSDAGPSFSQPPLTRMYPDQGPRNSFPAGSTWQPFGPKSGHAAAGPSRLSHGHFDHGHEASQVRGSLTSARNRSPPRTFRGPWEAAAGPVSSALHCPPTTNGDPYATAAHPFTSCGGAKHSQTNPRPSHLPCSPRMELPARTLQVATGLAGPVGPGWGSRQPVASAAPQPPLLFSMRHHQQHESGVQPADASTAAGPARPRATKRSSGAIPLPGPQACRSPLTVQAGLGHIKDEPTFSDGRNAARNDYRPASDREPCPAVQENPAVEGWRPAQLTASDMREAREFLYTLSPSKVRRAAINAIMEHGSQPLVGGAVQDPTRFVSSALHAAMQARFKEGRPNPTAKELVATALASAAEFARKLGGMEWAARSGLHPVSPQDSAS